MTTYPHEQKISSVQTDTPVFYPNTDGKPMAASELHRDILYHTINTLKAHYQKQPDVCVSGDLLMYYVKGDPRQVVAPDVFVSFGLDKKRRDTYLVWEEGKLPEFVMEFSSKTTYDDDLEKKATLYASLGIQDYFLYDAEGLFLPSPIMGYTLVDGVYEPISENENGSLHSDVLSLDFYAYDVHTGLNDIGLRIYDPVTETWLQTEAEARAEQEATRAETAEARAETAEARAETAEARAEQEATRAKTAEAEIAQLREQLKRIQTQR